MTEIVLTEEQVAAVKLICTARVGVVTGGAGTGKTTIVKAGLQLLDSQAEARNDRPPRVALAAPTGKAARRMQEATGRPAITIHRLLGFNPMVDGFTHGLDEPLPFDLVIVDEASMLDTHLAGALARAIDHRSTRLILIGDSNQLPPVGPGQTFADLLASPRVPTVRLTQVKRQAARSWVYRNAPRILEGIPENVEWFQAQDDYAFVEVDDPTLIPEHLMGVLQGEADALYDRHPELEAQPDHVWDRLQIIAPQKRGPCGVEAINETIQRTLRGHLFDRRGAGFSSSSKKDARRFFDGDKVMQTRNNYQKEVMNGESGIVFGQKDRRLLVDFDAERKEYDQAAAQDLTLGYAVTIHKSQGSQWPVVVFVCHSSHGGMLARRLAYTAITRAQRRLVVIGDRQGLHRAVTRDADASRQTRLQERIEDMLATEGAA